MSAHTPTLETTDPPAARDAQPERPPDPADAVARRRYERVGFKRKVRVTEIDEHGAPKRRFIARSFDLSRAGIGIQASAMVYPGKAVILEVLAGRKRVEKILYGIVRQTRYDAGDGYIIGVEFRRSPGEEILRQTLEDAGYLAPAV